MILLTPDADMARRVPRPSNASWQNCRELKPPVRPERQPPDRNQRFSAVRRDLQQYGPEHLIIQTRNARDLVDRLPAPVRYFSVTGHRNRQVISLRHQPRAADLRLHRHLFQPGLADFQKRMTVQELSKEGFSRWLRP